MGISGVLRTASTVSLIFGLAACEDRPGFFDGLDTKKEPAEQNDNRPAGARNSDRSELDVESPEVFQVEEAGLWDGRPSLGGVWVAYPGVKQPERVLIRNKSNNKSVVGALFRREIENPGPPLQLSSDAANALGVLAGQPVELSVTALRKEELPVEEEELEELDVTEPAIEADPVEDVEEGETQAIATAPVAVETTSIDPIERAQAAIEKSEELAPAADGSPVLSEAPIEEPVLQEQASAEAAPAQGGIFSLRKPYIQVGIYEDSARAEDVVATLGLSGIVANSVEQQSESQSIYRVVVGPSASIAERNALRRQIRAIGYTDTSYTTE